MISRDRDIVDRDTVYKYFSLHLSTAKRSKYILLINTDSK